jgi:hypothetical protein
MLAGTRRSCPQKAYCAGVVAISPAHSLFDQQKQQYMPSCRTELAAVSPSSLSSIDIIYEMSNLVIVCICSRNNPFHLD